MDERAKKILIAIVENYVETAEPIGSRTLTKKLDLGISPATIRNIMADLEDMGYLTQPHTSAGRLPTEKGYRFYVDSCIEEGHSSENSSALQPRVNSEDINRDMTTLIEDVTQELSKNSHHMGIATAPRFDRSRLSRVELIQVKPSQVLAVVITEEGIVRNLLLDLEEKFSQKHLSKLSSYINRELGGHTLGEARDRIISKVHEDKAAYDSLLSKAMYIGREIIERQAREDIYVGGYSEMLESPQFMDMEALREIFRAIEEKHLIIQVFNMIEEMEVGVKVLIGSENPVDEIHDCSMVVSPYLRQGRVIGTVGVIGPIRMHYPKVISMVDKTANFLTNVFSSQKGGSR